MLSFIVPTKNEEKIIEKTLQNIYKYQGEKEIIVSDGKSTDKTVLLAKKYAQVVEHKGVVRQTISAGRNAGAAIARGEILVFLDADVHISDPNIFFNTAENFFKENDKLMGLAVSLRVLPELETRADRIVFSLVNFLSYLQNNILGTGAASGEFQMIRGSAFKKVGGYNEKLVAGEDMEMFRRLRKIGKTYFAKELVVYDRGRRIHKIGWLRLLGEWTLNSLYVMFGKKAYSKEWKVIR